MGRELIISVTAISLALLFYTIGVWWEHRAKELRKVHFGFFVTGLVCDVTGTAYMSMMADKNKGTGALTDVHGITGFLAIALMLFHAAWALVVLLRNKPKERQSFHRFSVIVWAIWLVPYILGMVMGMNR